MLFLAIVISLSCFLPNRMLKSYLIQWGIILEPPGVAIWLWGWGGMWEGGTSGRLPQNKILFSFFVCTYVPDISQNSINNLKIDLSPSLIRNQMTVPHRQGISQIGPLHIFSNLQISLTNATLWFCLVMVWVNGFLGLVYQLLMVHLINI